jgi:hypothetical protein
MEASREELRERLVAALEASPELETEQRQYLADVFLNKLDEDYRLVPRFEVGARYRSTSVLEPSVRSDHFRPMFPVSRRFIFFVVFLLLVLTASFHAPGFILMALAFFLFWRFFWVGPGHRGLQGRRW